MLTLRDVHRRFHAGTANEARALDGIDLDMAEGDFIAVIGSNGAGKSTLLRAICGLIELDAGTVELDGRDVTRWPAHRRARLIGRVAQDPADGTCASMTVAENLAMALRRGTRRGLRRAVSAPTKRLFRERLAGLGLGLEERLDARAATLSGGQRQALALLMATIATPRLLLLDEHLANLDPRTAEIVMTLTGRVVAEARLTTIMVTHNMADALRWGNRLLMLHAGRVVFAAAGQAKAALTVPELVAKFHSASGRAFAEDRVLLAE